MDNIRQIVGEEFIDNLFATRHFNEKLKKKLPDGIYDFTTERGLGWREVIIDGVTIHIMTKEWVDKGGPAHLHEAIVAPWGTYEYPVELRN